MSHAAKLAPVTGLSRIDRDGLAGSERLAIAIDGIFADGLDDAREFVPQHQRALEDRRTDPAILVGMEIAAANSHGFHADQGLPGRGGRGAEEVFQPQVGRAVESNAAHWNILPEVRVAVTPGSSQLFQLPALRLERIRFLTKFLSVFPFGKVHSMRNATL